LRKDIYVFLSENFTEIEGRKNLKIKCLKEKIPENPGGISGEIKRLLG